MLKNNTEQSPINGMIETYFANVDERSERMMSDPMLILGKYRERNREIVATMSEAKSNSLINQNGRISNSNSVMAISLKNCLI